MPALRAGATDGACLPRSVGVDRESAVRKAEELVREGKIDLAIEEYLRLLDDQPGDVGAANALGDLYAKAGNRAAAVAQFVQIGDNHRDSGFVPKAVAFYKKALKVDPASRTRHSATPASLC